MSEAEGENIAGGEPEEAPEEDKSEVTVYEEGVELERTIGLKGALTIGIGTMIGAGIFVFPGLAVGEAGPAAAFSFVIGGLIALLVALPASELATAMPRSGGGYFFISRSMGSLPGATVGISLWFGLIFASAFYLIGFGYYITEILIKIGIQFPNFFFVAFAFIFGLILLVISLMGTENTTKLQNIIVIILLVILSIFVGVGSLNAIGLFGEVSAPEKLFLFGVTPVFSTAALVFTSYLGFAQVATLAGEIEEPSKNLPLSMIGSVVIVTVFYVLTIFVSTSALGSLRLSRLGETAIVEVSNLIFGPIGAVVILIAGLLATISSANASILSSSRAIYSVSKDALVPKKLSEINLRFGTPHISIILAGILILFLVLLNKVELLAEVASFLHLVMYGLICFSVIFFRKMDPSWYEPDFKVPGYPVIPIIGGLASFSLLFFMDFYSKIIGLGIMILSGLWFFYYASDIKLRGVI